MTDVLAGREQTIPALAMLTDCCSMASSRACCWCPSLSNSSMQHRPGEEKQREQEEENYFFSKTLKSRELMYHQCCWSFTSDLKVDPKCLNWLHCRDSLQQDYRLLPYGSFSYPGQPVPRLRPLKHNPLLLHLWINLQLVLKIKAVT